MFSINQGDVHESSVIEEEDEDGIESIKDTKNNLRNYPEDSQDPTPRMIEDKIKKNVKKII